MSGFLTILGIVIGIGSVITMVAIGQGSSSSITSSIESLGSNLLMVSPGFGRGVGQEVRGGRGSAVVLRVLVEAPQPGGVVEQRSERDGAPRCRQIRHMPQRQRRRAAP